MWRTMHTATYGSQLKLEDNSSDKPFDLNIVGAGIPELIWLTTSMSASQNGNGWQWIPTPTSAEPGTPSPTPASARIPIWPPSPSRSSRGHTAAPWVVLRTSATTFVRSLRMLASWIACCSPRGYKKPSSTPNPASGLCGCRAALQVRRWLRAEKMASKRRNG